MMQQTSFEDFIDFISIKNVDWPIEAKKTFNMLEYQMADIFVINISKNSFAEK